MYLVILEVVVDCSPSGFDEDPSCSSSSSRSSSGCSNTTDFRFFVEVEEGGKGLFAGVFVVVDDDEDEVSCWRRDFLGIEGDWERLNVLSYQGVGFIRFR